MGEEREDSSHTIAVFGLSGVGKTLACRNFMGRHDNWTYIRASEVLLDLIGAQRITSLSRAEIVDLQWPLADAIKARKPLRGNALIDAHSVIDSEPEPIVVPSSVVQRFSPTLLVFLRLDPFELWRRRDQDQRSRPLRSVEYLERQQRMARQAVSTYSVDLNVPLRVELADSPAILSKVWAETSRLSR